MVVQIRQGHVLDVLAGMEAGSVQLCVTSPPYWQLRSYGTEPQVWPSEDGAGAPGSLCAPEQHEWHLLPERTKGGTGQNSTLNNSEAFREARDTDAQKLKPGAFCAHCHAWRGEYGQEPTPELYLWHTVLWARAVRRVLRDDGTLFVNIAGCYWSDPGGQNGGVRHMDSGTGRSTLSGGRAKLTANSKHTASVRISQKAIEANAQNGRKQKGRHPVYKPLDYVDLPGLVARALQEDGWLWRSDMALVKVAPMPESVSGTRWERCRVKVRGYELSEEPAKLANPNRRQSVTLAAISQSQGAPSRAAAVEGLAEWQDCPGCAKCAPSEGLVLRRGSGRPTRAWERLLVFAKKAPYYWDVDGVREENAPGAVARFGKNHAITDGAKHEGMAGQTVAAMVTPEWRGDGRNARDWFLWRPEPLRDLHYAAFPSSIPAFAVKAGTSERGCCPACGAPWARVVERETYRERSGVREMDKTPLNVVRAGWRDEEPRSTTLGWRPTCLCPPHTPVPCRVLDPFGGSGTTALAADRLGRDAVLVELKPEYARLAERRLTRDAPLLMWGAVSLEGGEGEAPLEAPETEGTTKQERHPNRTVQGFNERYKAKQQALEGEAAG